MASLLVARDATVVICHRATRNLARETRRAEILVAAAGVPGLVRPEMVNRSAVIVDCGINAVPAGIVGDVEFPTVAPVVRAISPVPGGVGPGDADDGPASDGRVGRTARRRCLSQAVRAGQVRVDLPGALDEQRARVFGDLVEGHDARGVIGSAARIQRSEQTESLEALALVTGWRVHVRIVAPGADTRLSARR